MSYVTKKLSLMLKILIVITLLHILYMESGHRNIRYRMRALSCDRCPKWKQRCPYKSAILDFSEELRIQKVMGRVKFALINRPFSIVNNSSLVYLQKYRSTHSISNISMGQAVLFFRMFWCTLKHILHVRTNIWLDLGLQLNSGWNICIERSWMCSILSDKLIGRNVCR